MRQSKWMFTVVIVVGLVVGVQLTRFVVGKVRKGIPVSAVDSKAWGNPRTKVNIIEYTDFQCPACAKGVENLKEYMILYPQEISLHFRNFPLVGTHPHALRIAVYGQCAAQQKKFWPFHDLLFERQGLLKETINLEGRLSEIALEAGLETKALNACVKDKKTEESVMAERNEGDALGVKATPTYFINGQMVSGVNGLKEALDKYFPGKRP